MHVLPKPLQVYVVEGSPIIRRLLAATIEAAGGELIGVSGDAGRAIEDLSVREPDLVIVDLRLRSGSGFDVLEALHARPSKRRAIKVVLTNHASEQFRSLSFGLGANGFFDKGSDTAQLLALIHALADEKRARVWRDPRNSSVHRTPENDSRK
jgi:DNA-binding NarL/FixJ family response regulator